MKWENYKTSIQTRLLWSFGLIFHSLSVNSSAQRMCIVQGPVWTMPQRLYWHYLHSCAELLHTALLVQFIRHTIHNSISHILRWIMERQTCTKQRGHSLKWLIFYFWTLNLVYAPKTWQQAHTWPNSLMSSCISSQKKVCSWVWDFSQFSRKGYAVGKICRLRKRFWLPISKPKYCQVKFGYHHATTKQSKAKQIHPDKQRVQPQCLLLYLVIYCTRRTIVAVDNKKTVTYQFHSKATWELQQSVQL